MSASSSSALAGGVSKHKILLMACSDGEAKHQWIQNVQSGGAVPCLPPENCPNGWATPPGDTFMVRGPEYFATKAKIPGGEYLLKPLGVDWIKGSVKICEVLKNRNHRVRKAIDEEVLHGSKPFVWAFNLQLPSKENYSAIFYFVSLEPVPEGSLMDQFLKGDDALRKSRLKLIANIVKGPWIVRKAVGEQAICILGRALSCKYVQGSNFIEVDVDIGSSIVANAIVHLAFGYVATLTVDLAFVIESQAESELPERLLGAVRTQAAQWSHRLAQKTLTETFTKKMLVTTIIDIPESARDVYSFHQNDAFIGWG
ncbi:hypothetical protein ZWY2020_003698 [Hordeum vulgare]|nr:hypothetical protein ZWY2020_003698 [Hordeum vulgare]